MRISLNFLCFLFSYSYYKVTYAVVIQLSRKFNTCYVNGRVRRHINFHRSFHDMHKDLWRRISHFDTATSASNEYHCRCCCCY